jgi:hypothetical protein
MPFVMVPVKVLIEVPEGSRTDLEYYHADVIELLRMDIADEPFGYQPDDDRSWRFHDIRKLVPGEEVPGPEGDQ